MLFRSKLSVKPYEFDIGWLYIRLLSVLGLAKVKKTPPKLAYGDIQPVADEKTLEALIANRYEVMAAYARQLRSACRQDIQALKQRPADAVLRAARRWMHRDIEKIPDQDRSLVAQARASLPQADTMVRMREELRQLWLSTHRTRDQLAIDLQAWCRQAESSGIAALRDFSMRLRAARS